MAEVSRTVLKYAARGARKVQRADRNVRESIRETAKTARKEQGTINRWMQRNQAALAGVAAATTGAMAAVIRSSPTLSAQLSSVRLGFSMLAMTIGEDLAPATEGISQTTMKMADAYNSLDPAIRKPVSALVALVGVIFAVVSAVGVLAPIIGNAVGAFGTLATFLPSASAVLGGVGTAASVVAGLFSTLASIVVGVVSTIVGALSLPVIAVAAVVAAVVGLYLAWTNNWFGIRDKTFQVIDSVKKKIGAGWQWITSRTDELEAKATKTWNNLKSRTLGTVDDLKSGAMQRWRSLKQDAVTAVTNLKTEAVERAEALKSGVVSRAKSLYDGVTGFFSDMVSKASSWGSDIIGDVISGVESKVSTFVSAFESLGSKAVDAFTNAFNSVVPSSISIPSVSINIPDQLGGGSKRIGGGSIDIPQLAQGGLVTEPTLAMIGESGPEAVVPLNNPRRFGGGGAGGQTIIQITLEEGAVKMRGTGSTRTDEGRLADRVADEIDMRFNNRGGT